MGLDYQYNIGQTPLDDDEIEGLLIDSISTQSELDEFEQQNIEEAIKWVFTHSFKKEQILTEKFVQMVHKRMYGNVWAWAGKFRNSEKNIGIKHWTIPTELRKLLDDTLYWIDNESYSSDEIALQFKHRIVSIHCFPNRNGRHSRLMADIIIGKVFKQQVFTWGAANLLKQGESRINYLNALRAADVGDIKPLKMFARS